MLASSAKRSKSGRITSVVGTPARAGFTRSQEKNRRVISFWPSKSWFNLPRANSERTGEVSETLANATARGGLVCGGPAHSREFLNPSSGRGVVGARDGARKDMSPSSTHGASKTNNAIQMSSVSATPRPESCLNKGRRGATRALNSPATAGAENLCLECSLEGDVDFCPCSSAPPDPHSHTLNLTESDHPRPPSGRHPSALGALSTFGCQPAASVVVAHLRRPQATTRREKALRRCRCRCEKLSVQHPPLPCSCHRWRGGGAPGGARSPGRPRPRGRRTHNRWPRRQTWPTANALLTAARAAVLQCVPPRAPMRWGGLAPAAPPRPPRATDGSSHI